MRIAIYDVDSKIPNLALMKLSAHHKALGDTVEFYSPLERDFYDKIYASRIFKFSDTSMLNPDTMEIGGTLSTRRSSKLTDGTWSRFH